MRIALDIDGVLADFNSAYADLLEATGAPAIDRTPPWPTKWEWPDDVASPDVCAEAWALVQSTPEWFISLPPTIEALALASTGELQELFELHDIYLVTARPARSRSASEFWVSELLGSFHGTIHMEGPKGNLVSALGCELLVDDKPEHIGSASSLGVAGSLVARPWNSGGESLIHIVRALLQKEPA